MKLMVKVTGKDSGHIQIDDGKYMVMHTVRGAIRQGFFGDSSYYRGGYWGGLFDNKTARSKVVPILVTGLLRQMRGKSFQRTVHI